ncbi:hypothetical protein C9374_000538 [Naegleria lovaniensis]|uniref:RRM domain-containing protein n=1 Tax=Naegleria lovaniensis TaxID=51637 RepID=A0AA88KNT4_NAELO|nr:uncharacterized protein C9374_000538 [Naegleria lovaniensis]KAG2388374.1 hypothetical protein C9374_000538 [Naegleria lovaniensis]
MSNNNTTDFEANFEQGFEEETNHVSQTVVYPNVVQQQEHEDNSSQTTHSHQLIAGSDEGYDSVQPQQQQQVYYSVDTTSNNSGMGSHSGQSTPAFGNSSFQNNNGQRRVHSYVPTLIPEDIVHQYGINALTLDQIHRSVFVSINTPVQELSVQEISNFFSFCGSVEKIIIVDDLNGAVVCLENSESFSTSLLLNEMKLNEQTTLYIFNLCDLLGIPRKKAQSLVQNSTIPTATPSRVSIDRERETPSSQSAIQGLFQEGYIQSKNLFEQLKTKAQQLDQENDISKKVQQSLNHSKEQWIKFAKHMNENVESVKLKFVPIRESFNLQTVSQKAEQIGGQTQQYLSSLKDKVKEIGKDLNEKIKQQDQKTQFSTKIKEMKIEENLQQFSTKASEVVSKNWTAMTSFFKGMTQKGASPNTSASSSPSTSGEMNRAKLPPLPTKTEKKITSVDEDDSLWSSDNSAQPNSSSATTQQQQQFSLDNEEEDFPVEYSNTSNTSSNVQQAQNSADSFFD